MILKSHISYSTPSIKTVTISSSRRILSGSDGIFGAPGDAGGYDSDKDNDYDDITF